jgi:hypothetical protein
LKALEDRPAPEIDLKPVEKLIEAEIAKLPAPELPELPELPDFGDLIARAVSEAVAALPPPEPGKPGEDGKSVDSLEVNEMIVAAVSKAVESLPKPKDGKDAAGIVEALKDNGELVLTLQDGRLIRTGVRDGEKGKDGRDGFGFDDLDVAVLDDDRTLELSFRHGDEEKAFRLKWPTVLDRGVWKEESEYARGDGVSWGGSFWIAQRDELGKPDTKDSGWRLAVKKGRDGKDAKTNG